MIPPDAIDSKHGSDRIVKVHGNRNSHFTLYFNNINNITRFPIADTRFNVYIPHSLFMDIGGYKDAESRSQTQK